MDIRSYIQVLKETKETKEQNVLWHVGKNDPVAQLVEQYTFNVRVARSSRAGIT